jgi:hypothetical protein
MIRAGTFMYANIDSAADALPTGSTDGRWPIVEGARARRLTPVSRALRVRGPIYREFVGPMEEQISRVLGSHEPPSMITKDLSLTVTLQRMHRAIVLLAAEIDRTDSGSRFPPAPGAV